MSISHGLKLTGVKVPPVVLYGTSVHLYCNYQLGPNESLYSVKWYKNFTEFFSFVETDPNPIHSYAMPGIYVNVSNALLDSANRWPTYPHNGRMNIKMTGRQGGRQVNRYFVRVKMGLGDELPLPPGDGPYLQHRSRLRCE